MAIYNGRSVQIISTTPIEDPTITIAHKDGSTSVVKPSALQFTKVELDRIAKDFQSRFSWNKTATPVKNADGTVSPASDPNYKLIDDKAHQELVDGQDPIKMEEKVKRTPHPEVAIPAQTIKLTPVNTPVVTTPPSTK